MIKQNEMMSVEDVLEILAIPLLGIVPDDKQVIVASNRGEPLVLGDQKDSVPATAFLNIARRLEGEKVPLLDLMADQEGLLAKIRRFFAG
jgi:septum site-determining protein MinD